MPILLADAPPTTYRTVTIIRVRNTALVHISGIMGGIVPSIGAWSRAGEQGRQNRSRLTGQPAETSAAGALRDEPTTGN